jgi:hypothetical protein
MMVKYLPLILVACIQISCSKSGKKDEKPIARVYDDYLYPSDVAGKDLSGADSAERVKAFVNDWVNKQVLIHEAHEQLSDEQKDKEDQVREYLNSLLIYELERDYVAQNLDTAVSMEEITGYFNNYKANFEQKENIVRLNYVKLPIKDPGIDKLRKWFRSDDVQDLKKLIEYCRKNAVNSFFDDEVWLSFRDILKEIPIKTYDEEQFLKNNNYIEVKDETYIYFVKIISFRIKDSPAPLDAETENIRNIIINRRKVKLIMDLANSLKQDAEINNQIEIYE